MSQPEFVIDKLRRTSGGGLEISVLEQIRGTLLEGGLMLLPSDTCYSLGALPINEDTRATVNSILSRNLGPISLAFGSYPQVQQFIEVSDMIGLLLAHFTPGPITIVCKAREAVPEDFMKTIGSSDRTIGVRIPDSYTERDIAASTEYPLMTVAVRDLNTGKEIRDFKQALELVSVGIEGVGKASWGAIEGLSPFRDSHSTVIRVSDVDKVELLRQGAIPFEEIQDYINDKGKHLLHAATLSKVISAVRPNFPAAVQPPGASPSQESSAKHREWFWNAFALGMVILATYFFGGLFGAFWGCCALGIYHAPWFKSQSRDQRFVMKGILLTVVSLIVWGLWAVAQNLQQQTH